MDQFFVTEIVIVLQNEISDFLNDIMQPTKVLLSLLSNNDAISVQGKPAVSPVDAQLLKTLLSGTLFVQVVKLVVL